VAAAAVATAVAAVAMPLSKGNRDNGQLRHFGKKMIGLSLSLSLR
jgi:hypothetical protein